ncbi:ankyrin repeat domain-containing protein [Candidatus Neoehrlichia procyonis]|uniref:Ankyrin repeat family protein n=1 Tax=Candidatus Neoehrlichia procyonis str. RAC413 TaxID=1359163 RepID=A0A0F3NN22_9RICK|nr:ankyrin repeat domain-containing protein [Candidatus Neoehrlichia lotoris]KJV69077.1 ankyrin repeat family protein [Candidatus Neoehrlichia lotoris str. RAC413]
MKKFFVTAALLTMVGLMDSIASESHEDKKVNDYDMLSISKSLVDKDNDIKNDDIGVNHNVDALKHEEDVHSESGDFSDDEQKLNDGHDLLNDEKNIEDDQKLHGNDSNKLMDDVKKNKEQKKDKKEKDDKKSKHDQTLENIDENDVINKEDADLQDEKLSNEKEMIENNDANNLQDKSLILSSNNKIASEWKNLNSGQLLSDKWLFYRNAIESIEVDSYDQNNSHLPRVASLHDYYQQAFYCVNDNDVSGLRAVIYKLENLGVNVTTILEDLRTQDRGDNLLLYAIRKGNIDVVRFLLSLGSGIGVNNYQSETPLGIAVQSDRTDIIDAVIEMQ